MDKASWLKCRMPVLAGPRCGSEFSRLTFLPSCLPPFIRLPDPDAGSIPLINVKGSVLKKVVEYMKYHADNPSKEIEKVRLAAFFADC
jgi:hypothetical protein